MAGKSNIFQRILQLVLDKQSVEKTKQETQKALKDATDPKAAEANVNKLDKAFTKLKVSAIALATALVAGVALGLRKVIQESSESQKVLAQQEAVLRSTGMAAGRTAKQLNDQANALQKVTTFTDEQVTSAQNLLLTFRHLREDELDKAVVATLNMATAMGTDASSAALQLGKALEDPITGLTALRRSGVSFSTSQRDVIKQLVETGRVAEAQRLILKELDVQFGGSAEAARNTLGGALEGLRNAWGELFEVSRDSSDGIIRFINAVAAWLPTLDAFLDKALRVSAVIFRGRQENSFSERLRLLTQRGFGDVRIQEGLDDPENRRQRAAAARQASEDAENQVVAQKAIADAEAERRKAAAEAAEERRKAAEQQIDNLITARNLGIQSIEDDNQLLTIWQALAVTLRDGNLALEERVRLAKILKDIFESHAMREIPGAKAGETLGRFGLPARTGGGGLIAAPGQPIVAPELQPSTEGADKTRDSWVDALQTIGAEAQIASVLIAAAFDNGEGFRQSLARLAKAKAKENVARSIETLAGGLAALVFGDPSKLVPAAQASAGFLAAAGVWSTLGGGAGSGAGAGPSGGGGGGFTPRSPAGRSIDKSSVPTQTIIYVNMDALDPKNGTFQSVVGQANVYFNQRRGEKITDGSLRR